MIIRVNLLPEKKKIELPTVPILPFVLLFLLLGAGWALWVPVQSNLRVNVNQLKQDVDSLEKEIIVCDKKKSSYVEVSKNTGVKVLNKDGKTIETSSTRGVIINGKPLNEILSSAFKPLNNLFGKKDSFHDRRRY